MSERILDPLPHNRKLLSAEAKIASLKRARLAYITFIADYLSSPGGQEHADRVTDLLLEVEDRLEKLGVDVGDNP
jgi:hypothetical protein